MLARGRDLPAGRRARRARRAEAWRRIGLDPGGAVRIPAGTALDLGATAKAWAADLVATACRERARRRRAGQRGRRRLRSPAPTAEPWPVGISERPGDRRRRAWSSSPGRAGHAQHPGPPLDAAAGAVRHHLLDPRTGLPADEAWRTVTATGPTCLAANTASTAAVVLGAAAPAWLAARGVTARLVAADGTVHRVGDWPADLRGGSVA